MIRTAAAVLALAAIASPLAAQSSVFAAAGLGFPGDASSARARAMGGGLAVHDRASGLNPGAAGAFRTVAVGMSMVTSNRSYDIGSTGVDGLRDTRFPNAYVGAPIGESPWHFSVGFSQLAERSFDITSLDTLVLSGSEVEISDRIIADGGISDMRFALARSLGDGLWLGVGAHVISGSSRSRITREFSDPRYVAFRQSSQVEYSGAGVDAGFALLPAPFIQISGAARIDSRLRSETDSVDTGSIELPRRFSAGVSLRPSPSINLATTISLATWSVANDDLVARGQGRAFDSWRFGAGLELGGAGTTGLASMPLRVGASVARLPFSVTGDQPEEFTIGGGTGLTVAQGRVQIDLAIERISREGAGASERGIMVTLGAEVRP